MEPVDNPRSSEGHDVPRLAPHAIVADRLVSHENIPNRETRLPRKACIPRLIERHARNTPNALALLAGKEAITYAELEARSAALAGHLRSMGVGREVVVGICMDRSVAFVVAALGIMKAGGAYLPLDPNYPKSWLSSEL